MNSFHKDNLEALQKFQQMLNATPDKEGIEKTPDGKAVTLVVSHVETTLDEMFFGHWRTENFKWERIANEIVGSLDLVVIHPITGYELRRTGAGSIVIMVDKVPPQLPQVAIVCILCMVCMLTPRPPQPLQTLNLVPPLPSQVPHFLSTKKLSFLIHPLNTSSMVKDISTLKGLAFILL